MSFVLHLQNVQTFQRLQLLLASLAGGAPPVVKQTMDLISLSTLTLPYLLEIISPSLRPVSGWMSVETIAVFGQSHLAAGKHSTLHPKGETAAI